MNCLNDKRNSKFKAIICGLMKRYLSRVPDLERILNVMIFENLIKSEQDLEYDHIAFSTLRVDNLGISSLEKVFLHYGYYEKHNYYQKSNKTNISWYTHSDTNLPKIVISELVVGELSDACQDIIHSCTKSIKSDPVDEINLNDVTQVDTFLHNSSWKIPVWEDFKIVNVESNFASTVLYNNHYLNHFTVLVNNLKQRFNKIHTFNTLLKQNNILLGNYGELARATGGDRVSQISTLPHIINVPFFNKLNRVVVKPISGSFLEFVELKVLDIFKHLPKGEIKREKLLDGYDIESQEKILEHTFQG